MNPYGQPPAPGFNPGAPGYPPPQQSGGFPAHPDSSYGAPGFGGGQNYPPAYPPNMGYTPQGPIVQQPGAYGGPGYPPTGAPQPGYPAPGAPQPGFPGQAPPYHGQTPNFPPGQDGWMSLPPRAPNCPPGLEYLTQIDQLLVHQKVELLEAFTGFETNNKFTIKNSMGQKVYWAAEDVDCCTRNCCGPMRPFDMKILDIYKNQVMHLYRPLRCQSCCFPCCLQTMEVSAPPGNVIGTIEQEWSIFTPQFSLKDQSGETVLRIEGPFCTFSICGDVEFKVLTRDGQQVGKVSKQWSGLAREMFTDADHFGINFPMDLDVRMKAVLIGACFLIDVMFFEKSGNQEQDRPGMF
ncbi:phospholipid scramblase 2 [Phlebotomus papatasi]|uniref:phospholipid scramblase 2 n=1 Tax=Phlebotomus papatasi TaxID=29031 RepID=UPI0024838D6E|nr:phospholipid scramblase 2 [Phlebotomus papatasi]